ncbi:MAG TPA: GDP-L-fucose synthase [Candidatus Omnitrophota bacterium]|nr:GDP-L-fucose synthase [Candidatus Omnitrophota bacterium]
MKKGSKIYLAGHTGLVGSALYRGLQSAGYTNIIVRDISEFDLRDQAEVEKYFEAEKPEYVFLAAAKVGGILANNTYKAEFIYDNIMIAANVIQASYRHGVKKLLNLGSSCIYPKLAPQPLREDHLLTGPLEPTNEPYAVAKIAAIKLCRYYNEQYGTDFISVMPTNQYGINDNFNLETSHVLPAMIRKFHDAKLAGAKAVALWGTGGVYREFMCSDDLASACIFLMENRKHDEIGEFVNIGTGEDLLIRDLAEMIKGIVGFKGEIVWDKTKPDGTPKKLLDISRLRSLGWAPKIGLKDGITMVYDWYLERR